MLEKKPLLWEALCAPTWLQIPSHRRASFRRDENFFYKYSFKSLSLDKNHLIGHCIIIIRIFIIAQTHTN